MHAGLLRLLILVAGVLATVGAARAADPPLPIVFVHGNGDTAGLWITTLWRFESNGYPRDRLFTVDLRNPLARTVDDTPQAGRSSTHDVMRQLADEVEQVRAKTGAEKVVLVGQSRGGNTVRNYLKNGGGAAVTELAILCGAVTHGVIVSAIALTGSEFNGASAFLRDLNGAPDELVPGVRFVTIRSDSNDKFAQKVGRFIGLPGIPTGLDTDAPALKGATNIVLAGVDHRETGFAPQAFAAIYRAVTGDDPRTLDVTPEPAPMLDGKVSGFEAGSQTNIAAAGAAVSVFRVVAATGERMGEAVHRKVTGADGLWGPFTADPAATYEFVVELANHPTTHIYRSPFPRSSAVLHLRPQMQAKDDAGHGAVVYMQRPRGYYGAGRDLVEFDGTPATAIPAGVPSVSAVKHSLPDAAPHSVTGRFNDERIAARTWPLAENHVSVIEITN